MLDAQTGEQMALLAGKVEPTTFAGYCIELALYYNDASLMIERNNHGHVVIAAALEDGRVRVLDGLDGRPGWLNNQKGKRVLYADAAELMRSGQFRLYDRESAMQLMSIEASTLRAPAGMHDDRADAFVLALVAPSYSDLRVPVSTVVEAADPLAAYDDPQGGW